MTRAAAWVAAATAPLVVLGVVLGVPEADARWENHPAHFWLVLGAAAAAVGLGASVTGAARRRRDARLLLVSLAFVASAAFLGLHALATPGVLVGPNAGFELATPVGLLVGGAFVAASGLELSPRMARQVFGASAWLTGALAVLVAAWAAVSLAQLPPLASPLVDETLDGWQTALGGVGVALYGLGAFGYARLYRRRRQGFLLSVTLAFALLAEAMVVIAFARNWRVSWWEWHLLMLAAFALIAVTAWREWHEERFSAIYLDETLAGAKEASVLFADLQGYTSFAERTAPAAVTEMLNAYFERLVPLLEAERAEVHQLIGDAVMAIWNKDGDCPDHARRAARAGLAFQREAGDVAAAHAEWPRFRVGVNSGEVLAGVLGGRTGHRKHGIVGDTVNLAARLESQAPVGEVVIGVGTYERLGSGAVVERLPPLEVKGKREPVEAYVLHALRDDGGTT